MVPIEWATTASAGPKRQKTSSSALASSTPWVRPGPAGPASESPWEGPSNITTRCPASSSGVTMRPELRAAPAPPVDEVDGPRTLAPDEAADRVPLGPDLERRAALGHRRGRPSAAAR